MHVKIIIYLGFSIVCGSIFAQNINSGDKIKFYITEAEISEARGEYELGCKMAKLATDYAEGTNRYGESAAIKNRICLIPENKVKLEKERQERFNDSLKNSVDAWLKKINDPCFIYGEVFKNAREQCAVAYNLKQCINIKMGFDANHLFGCPIPLK